MYGAFFFVKKIGQVAHNQTIQGFSTAKKRQNAQEERAIIVQFQTCS